METIQHRPKLRVPLALIVAASFGLVPAAAEELVLKDGQKVVGTIVGFENDMFRVETEFGFALIRKDKVVTVNFNAGGKDAASKKQPERKKAPGEPPAEKPSRPAPAEAASSAAAVKRAPVPPPVSKPVDEPMPASVQEHVDGASYVNDSFHFAMFRPLGWKVFENVPKETGSAIVAFGTEDEQTLLFVDRQVWSGTPDVKSDFVEDKLRKTYPEYQKISESRTEIDGRPAIQRVFRGVLDGVEWHGLSVHVAQGNAVFGIVGLTSAETFQFEQAIFNKIFKSFRFLPPPAGPSSSAGLTR